jgi:hypothetical protein
MDNKNKMYMHEFGHYLDSRIWGTLYFTFIGAPSLLSAIFSNDVTTFYNGSYKSLSAHHFRPYERRANRFAAKYFKKHYKVTWDEKFHPTKDRR